MIIGFLGKARAGKSTAAAYLAEQGYERHNFKDALVAEMKKNLPDALYNLAKLYSTVSISWAVKFRHDSSREEMVNFLFEDKPEVMRALMQNYGTELRRTENPNYWTQQWVKSIEGKKNVAVDDVRFINEAKAVKDAGGWLIRVKREAHNPVSEHASETEQDSIVADFTIEVGNKKQADLYRMIEEFIKEKNERNKDKDSTS